ncbi:TPA: hypothetical protein ACNVXF_002453 [Citrobacter freundii]|uniref:hypothetical protein n=1 Tax=Enterobacter asburiae TaxID=61645 RepID=UPI003AFD9670
MNTKNSVVIIERAKSVLTTLIAAREELDECTIESNLFMIQQLLDDANHTLLTRDHDSIAHDKLGDLIDDVFDVVIAAKKMEELSHMYTEFYFTDKDSDNPKCYMADAIHDYAQKVCKKLKKIESKLS